MSNETYLTIRGFVGADPTVFHNDATHTTAVIRVGVTARNFDRRTGLFADGVTAWYSVRCYGELATNVTRSVKRGTPVIVRGRLSPRQWTDKEGTIKTDNVVVADSVGIDLNTGWASFVRARKDSLEPVEGEPMHAASGSLVAPSASSADMSQRGYSAESASSSDSAVDGGPESSAESENTRDPAGNLAFV